jgi:hypothetical protein
VIDVEDPREAIRRPDRRRSHPPLPAPGRRPLELPRPRADPPGAEPRRHPRALERPGHPPHRLHRPRAARREAGARRRDRPPRAGRPARRTVRLFNLGAIALEQQDWSGVLEFLRRSLAHSAPSDSITRKTFALIAKAHLMPGESGAALRACEAGLSYDPSDAELWVRQGIVHRQRGESAVAEACWRRIPGLSRPERFGSVDVTVHESRVTKVQSISGRELTSWMLRSIRPTRANYRYPPSRKRVQRPCVNTIVARVRRDGLGIGIGLTACHGRLDSGGGGAPPSASDGSREGSAPHVPYLTPLRAFPRDTPAIII